MTAAVASSPLNASNVITAAATRSIGRPPVGRFKQRATVQSGSGLDLLLHLPARLFNGPALSIDTSSVTGNPGGSSFFAMKHARFRSQPRPAALANVRFCGAIWKSSIKSTSFLELHQVWLPEESRCSSLRCHVGSTATVVAFCLGDIEFSFRP